MPIGGTTNPYGTSKYMIERILKDTLILLNLKQLENNLMPFISQVAVGGTDVRDYIHVVDLANAHVKAIEYLKEINLGTGKGYSVLEMVKAFEKKYLIE